MNRKTYRAGAIGHARTGEDRDRDPPPGEHPFEHQQLFTDEPTASLAGADEFGITKRSKRLDAGIERTHLLDRAGRRFER